MFGWDSPGLHSTLEDTPMIVSVFHCRDLGISQRIPVVNEIRKNGGHHVDVLEDMEPQAESALQAARQGKARLAVDSLMLFS